MNVIFLLTASTDQRYKSATYNTHNKGHDRDNNEILVVFFYLLPILTNPCSIEAVTLKSSEKNYFLFCLSFTIFSLGKHGLGLYRNFPHLYVFGAVKQQTKWKGERRRRRWTRLWHPHRKQWDFIAFRYYYQFLHAIFTISLNDSFSLSRLLCGVCSVHCTHTSIIITVLALKTGWNPIFTERYFMMKWTIKTFSSLSIPMAHEHKS